MTKSYLTKEDIDKNVLVSDFLIGRSSVFFGQEGNTRQFLAYPPGKDDYIVVFANMDRNDWYCTNPVMGGKVTDLAEKVFSMPPNDATLNKIYKMSTLIDCLTKPSTYLIDTTDKIQVPVDVVPLEHSDILALLYCMGISQSVAYKFMKDGTYTGIRDGEEHHTPLFPNSNGGYYGLTANGWRTLGKEGITLLGPTRDLQRLCVFENPLDFLALQQKRHRL